MQKRYKLLLTIAYIGLIIFFVALNLFGGQSEGLANIVVNVAMFVIVGWILISCEIGSFRPTERIVGELRQVTEKIKLDARHERRFLWEKYKEDKEELFTGQILKEQYYDYQYEMDRITSSDMPYYKCDIEDYINYDLIDSVIHRNRLNQVAGAMTGLGILGTFIGLSLGLRSFNTGSTVEIANSIEPLMDGIKVAFQTSIYGMVLSLIFNYVYKRILEDAENSVRDFVVAHKKHVVPDTFADGFNRLVQVELQQADLLKNLSKELSYHMSEGLEKLLSPQFDSFNETITGFANMATKNQMDQLSVVVQSFLTEMDRSLGDTFKKLSETIDSTMEAQRINSEQMERLAGISTELAENVNEITKQTGQTTGALAGYIGEVRNLRDATNSDLGQTYRMLETQLKYQAELIGQLERAVSSLPQDISDSLRIINENLQYIEGNMNETIEKVRETVEHIPEAVDYSYLGLERSFRRADQAVEKLSNSVDALDRHYFRK